MLRVHAEPFYARFQGLVIVYHEAVLFGVFTGFFLQIYVLDSLLNLIPFRIAAQFIVIEAHAAFLNVEESAHFNPIHFLLLHLLSSFVFFYF